MGALHRQFGDLLGGEEGPDVDPKTGAGQSRDMMRWSLHSVLSKDGRRQTCVHAAHGNVVGILISMISGFNA